MKSRSDLILTLLLAAALMSACSKVPPSADAELKPKLLEVAGLIQSGKNDEAARAVNALLVVYPEEPRLLALRAQATGEATDSGRREASAQQVPPLSVDAGLAEVNRLVQADKLPEALVEARKLAAAYPQDGRVAALVKQVVAAQPAEKPAVLTPDDLAGLERVKYEAGAQLLREAQAAGTAQPQVRAEKVKAFLAQTAELAATRPTLLNLHLQRATAALEVQDRKAGVQAVAALVPLGILETKDAAQLTLLGKLDLAGWLAEGRALTEAGPALAELKRLAEANDYAGFGAKAAEFHARWQGEAKIVAQALPWVAAVETASGQDLPGWGVDTNAKTKQAAAAKAEAERKAAEDKLRAEVEAKVRQELAEQQKAEAARLAAAGPTTASERRGLVKIEPGAFQMGSTSGGDSDERPVTRVTLTRPFWLGKHEVTQRLWQEAMGGNPSHFTGDDRPVENVSWDEAREFCRKLTERDRAAGTLSEGWAYRLPTEAEWEYACRAGTTDEYAGPLPAMGWFSINSGNTTHPVGEKRANAWGLHDMHGNVWEWCADWKDSYPGGSVTDPTGPSSGANRVYRGGSWNDGAFRCRSAYRVYYSPGRRSFDLGFRLALSSVR